MIIINKRNIFGFPNQNSCFTRFIFWFWNRGNPFFLSNIIVVIFLCLHLCEHIYICVNICLHLCEHAFIPLNVQVLELDPGWNYPDYDMMDVKM